jgi:hypothetical protein
MALACASYKAWLDGALRSNVRMKPSTRQFKVYLDSTRLPGRG